MNEHELNEIEERLSVMRPSEPSPAVKQRIAETLETGDRAVAPGKPLSIGRPLAIALAIAAAVALAGWVVVSITADKAVEEPPIVEDKDFAPGDLKLVDVGPSASGHKSIAPTWLELKNAYRQSPQQVEALLDQNITDRLTLIPDHPNRIPTAASGLPGDFYKDLP